jgi:hypothetical protein
MTFPSSAQNNQLFRENGIVYRYDSSLNAWFRYQSTTANVITTDTANIVSNISSISTTTGALTVSGGVGIQGNVFADAVYTNSYFYANGTAFSGGGAGSIGFTGSAGSAGFTGSAGSAGFTGSAGSAGFTGSAGVGTNLSASWAYLTSGSTSGTGWQKVPINTISVDEANWWDNTNKYFKPTLAGWYLIAGRVRTNSLAIAALAVGKNGTHNQGIGNDTQASQVALGGSQIIYLNGTTDYIDLRVYANTSGVAYSTGVFDTYLQISGPLQAGPTGYTGSASAGFTGSAGSSGFTGSTGSTGFTGSFGSNGFTGSTGTGFTGSSGFTGSTGTGFTGSAGTQGTIGYTGSAGTGGGGGGGYTGSAGVPGTLASGVITNTFNGDGTTTTFTLSVAPVSIDATIVNIDGVLQQRSSYTVSGYTLTLSEALLAGESMEVTIITYGTTNFVARTYTADGSTANYAVTLGSTVNSVIVTENGVVQTPTTDYTISGNVLTFNGAPANGTAIGIREIPAGAVGGNSVYSRTLITATAGQTSFAVAYTVGFLEVYYNGALLPPADYTATTGSTVVLTDAAAVDDQLEFITYNVVPVTAVPNATLNSTNITANLAITAGYSAVSVGPISIANGVTISIADGQKWVIL